MKPARTPNLSTVEAFVRYHTASAQDVANMTGEVTDLYRREDGTAGMTVSGWPLDGLLLATFSPVATDPSLGRRRAAWRGQATGRPSGSVSTVGTAGLIPGVTAIDATRLMPTLTQEVTRVREGN